MIYIALKAGEIIESFKEFKAEILGKAENSRTGLSISKRKIEEFDVAGARVKPQQKFFFFFAPTERTSAIDTQDH